MQACDGFGNTCERGVRREAGIDVSAATKPDQTSGLQYMGKLINSLPR